MNILITGASLSATNMGVGALTAGLINCLKKTAPDINIYILDYGKKQQTLNCITDQGEYCIPIINLRFSKYLFQKNNIAFLIFLALLIKLIPVKGIKNCIISSNKTLQQILEVDIVGSIAGGDSFSDIYGYFQFFYVSLPQILAILLNKKLIQFPQTFGPYRSLFTKLTAKFILSNSLCILSRDHEGVDAVKRMLGNSKRDSVTFCYDVGFALNPISPSPDFNIKTKFDKESLLAGLNISGLLYMGGYTKKNMFGLKIDYPLFIEKCLEWIIEKNGMNTVLIPHVYGKIESDLIVCRQVYENNYKRYGKRLQIIETEYNQHQIKYCIGQVDFFIGSRMHACIAALSQCIPVAGIAYSPKFMGVFRSFGMGDMVIDLTQQQSIEVILNKLQFLFDKKDDILFELRIQNVRVRNTIHKQFQKLVPDLCIQKVMKCV